LIEKHADQFKALSTAEVGTPDDGSRIATPSTPERMRFLLLSRNWRSGIKIMEEKHVVRVQMFHAKLIFHDLFAVSSDISVISGARGFETRAGLAASCCYHIYAPFAGPARGRRA
jgi:hypothetical protein